jgi:hypothetical protein
LGPGGIARNFDRVVCGLGGFLSLNGGQSGVLRGTPGVAQRQRDHGHASYCQTEKR